MKQLRQGGDRADRGTPWQGNTDDLLAAALAAGKTAREAATVAGVAERTAHRRLADDPFRWRVSELRAGILGAAAGRLADAMTSAADVLRALLADPDPDVRYRAAVKVIELGLKVGEVADLQRRVDDLERRFAGEGNP